MGDFNSFTDGALDKWQGVWQVRDQCLAMKCKEAGLQDTWRLAHPRLQAFTYVSSMAVPVGLIKSGCSRQLVLTLLYCGTGQGELITILC